MANVQIENGFTKIANELFDVILISNLSLRELKILFCVIRFTYGFNRKEANLSARFIGKATGIKANHIFTSVRDLIEKKILLSKNSKSGIIRKYQVNKDYEKWNIENNKPSTDLGLVEINKPSTKIGLLPSTDLGLLPSSKRVTKKENYKENIKEIYIHDLQKEIIKKYPHVAKMEIQLSNEDCEKLTKQFTDIEIHEILSSMENYIPLLKKNRSVNSTFLNWQKRNYKSNGSNGKAKVIVNDTLDLSNG